MASSSESSAPTFTEEDLLAFHDCARYGELEDVALCLSEKVPVDWQDEKGSTALHKAAANGHAAVIKLLASHGAKFLPNESKSTPLHWAAMNGEKDAVAALLEAYDDSVDVLAKNDSGRSAMTEALTRGHEEVARILLAHKSGEQVAASGAGAAAGGAGAEGEGGPEEEETDEEVDDDGEGEGDEGEEEDAAAKAAEEMLRGGGGGGAGGAGAGGAR